jgi:hypothetical protein
MTKSCLLSVKQKLSLIRSVNYKISNKKLYYIHNLPEDILRYIFELSGELEILIILTLYIKTKNHLCLYIDPRKDINYLYKKIIDTLTLKYKEKSFIGIMNARLSVNCYSKVLNIKTKGEIKDHISNNDFIELVGPIPRQKEQIFIKGCKTYTISIDLNESVDHLMDYIYRKVHIEKRLQIISYAGKNLHAYPFISLFNLGIQKESTINLTMRM